MSARCSRPASLWEQRRPMPLRTRRSLMFRSGRSLVALGAVASALVLVGVATASATPLRRTTPAARGLAPLVVKGATTAGAPTASRVRVTLALVPRNAARLDALVA